MPRRSSRVGAGRDHPPGDAVTDVDTAPLEQFVGTSLVEFTKRGRGAGRSRSASPSRTASSLPVTMDYSPSRVNVAVEGEGDAATVTEILNVG